MTAYLESKKDALVKLVLGLLYLLLINKVKVLAD
jgi:hypothetical protein